MKTLKFNSFEITLTEDGQHNSYSGSAIIAGYPKDTGGYSDEENQTATELLKAESADYQKAIKFNGLKTHYDVRANTLQELIRCVSVAKRRFEEKRKLVKDIQMASSMAGGPIREATGGVSER